jgi:hypothetical protein
MVYNQIILIELKILRVKHREFRSAEKVHTKMIKGHYK